MIENNKCPQCGNDIEDDDNLICMYCGYSLKHTKQLDTPNPNEIQKEDENLVNTVISFHSLWWVLLIIGGIISSIVSLSLLLDLL